MGPVTVLLHVAPGGGLVVAGWLMPRRLARSRFGGPAALLLDAAPLALGALLLGIASGRPLFVGVVVLALGAAFTVADYAMRETLREPVVFSESVELPQVFTHPHLYLPFAGPGLVLGGGAAALALAVMLLAIEPPLWPPQPLAAAGAAALFAAVLWLLACPFPLAAAARVLHRLEPRGEPDVDAAALGPFAMLIVHTVLARAERPARQRSLAAPALVRARGEPEGGPTGGPIVIVQCESFFDARRLSPRIPRELLPGFEACCTSAAQFGRLEVPGWGANTMRTEFAVLSGVPESELGYDRFNPYYALARVPLASQVWRLRRAGYRTICLHPFDRRFFRRDLVMPALGFDEFLGRETLGGARRPPYCPDPELGRHILRLLDAAGPRTFIFAITMGNHGPWMAKGPPLDPAIERLFDRGELPDDGGLLRYLDGLRRSDEMLRLLAAGLERRDDNAVLGFYGDHLPSLSGAFAHFGFDEPHSDYAIWPGASGAPRRIDVPAHRLGSLVIDAALGTMPVPEGRRRLEAAG
ncbi:MAG TPA: LTA synthase family protein [Stellaceae bacterium]|nr:LTA synthase family protein [Stellaceae bacterium]